MAMISENLYFEEQPEEEVKKMKEEDDRHANSSSVILFDPTHPRHPHPTTHIVPKQRATSPVAIRVQSIQSNPSPSLQRQRQSEDSTRKMVHYPEEDSEFVINLSSISSKCDRLGSTQTSNNFRSTIQPFDQETKHEELLLHQSEEESSEESDYEEVPSLSDPFPSSASPSYFSIRQMVASKVPPSKMVRCILRTSSGSLNLTKIYEFYLADDKRLIMRAAKNRLQVSGSRVLIRCRSEGEEVLAEVVSNFTRTEFKLISQIGREICFLEFQNNWLGFHQQRVKCIRPKGNRQVQPSERFSSLKAAYDNCEFKRVELISSKLAEQKKPNGQLHLDFKDPKLETSTKNMMLQTEEGDICLTFAKHTTATYTLNTIYPFSLLEAFFIGICNIDKKMLPY